MVLYILRIRHGKFSGLIKETWIVETFNIVYILVTFMLCHFDNTSFSTKLIPKVVAIKSNEKILSGLAELRKIKHVNSD